MARRRVQRPPWWREARLRRALRTLLLVAALMMLAFAGQGAVAYLMEPDTLPIRSVEVEGELRYLGPEALSAAITPHVQGGFFSLDLRQVEAAVKALPWVRGVWVHREWPDRIVIRIEEQVPVARWGSDALVNQYGELFRPALSEAPEGLPFLEGREGRQRQLMERFLAVQARLADVGLEVSGLKEDARRSWVIQLENGGQVLMGRGMDADRLDRLVRMYPRLEEHRDEPIRRIDMRYTNGIAVAWKPREGGAQ
ncbi:cell division protein FtsQ/DivIB [Ectothiorhodospira shaposhnikovii]|uniref:cell division protein FtsQ/DivIB n=1 Tax=Ectothiorhodospira shaposhnikovii TaxID=1054 RepID=UPI001EE848DE|nr:cell division protein FtsQ/DivIB [Ectothiorhodospira shaposhnikovii]MCG5513446.1 cell division protein FtsQ/DivIB [Ectothiorhodospira shaposhnikovii]